MTAGIKPVTVNVYEVFCQADGCKASITVRGTMAISALQTAHRGGWHTTGRKNLCRKHADQADQPKAPRKAPPKTAAKK